MQTPDTLTATATEFRQRLTTYLRAASAGQSTVVTSDGYPLAVLVPVAEWREQTRQEGKP